MTALLHAQGRPTRRCGACRRRCSSHGDHDPPPTCPVDGPRAVPRHRIRVRRRGGRRRWARRRRGEPPRPPGRSPGRRRRCRPARPAALAPIVAAASVRTAGDDPDTAGAGPDRTTAAPAPARAFAPRIAIAGISGPKPKHVSSGGSTRGSTSGSSSHVSTSSASHKGRNHVWIPALGISRSISSYSCGRSSALANLVYRWGCAGTNNVYLIGHAWGVFKPLHDAYVRRPAPGRHDGLLRRRPAAASTRTRVTWWKVDDADDGRDLGVGAPADADHDPPDLRRLEQPVPPDGPPRRGPTDGLAAIALRRPAGPGSGARSRAAGPGSSPRRSRSAWRRAGSARPGTRST